MKKVNKSENVFDYWFSWGTVVAFYPYTSNVYNRIVEVRDYYENDYIKNLKPRLVEWFNQEGIKAQDDNKIVFQININGFDIYIGFYDFTILRLSSG